MWIGVNVGLSVVATLDTGMLHIQHLSCQVDKSFPLIIQGVPKQNRNPLFYSQNYTREFLLASAYNENYHLAQGILLAISTKIPVYFWTPCIYPLTLSHNDSMKENESAPSHCFSDWMDGLCWSGSGCEAKSEINLCSRQTNNFGTCECDCVAGLRCVG